MTVAITTEELQRELDNILEGCKEESLLQHNKSHKELLRTAKDLPGEEKDAARFTPEAMEHKAQDKGDKKPHLQYPHRDGLCSLSSRKAGAGGTDKAGRTRV